MNSKEITYQLKNPEAINSQTTEDLENVIQEFPYFQAAKALQLKGLYNVNSYKYNLALKKTAAYTIDRNVLFDFITSLNFDKKDNTSEILEEIELIDIEIVEALNTTTKEATLKESNVGNSETIAEATEDILEIGKPLTFNTTEPHSFNEWLQLASKKPINRENSEKKEAKPKENKTTFKKKINLINKFIESNPKIKPGSKNSDFQNITPNNNQENESLMTETLAKIYLEQKKYDNAIKAYRILSLKYPEKSGFFADRIKAIKILQKK